MLTNKLFKEKEEIVKKIEKEKEELKVEMIYKEKEKEELVEGLK